jgi:hypothetical protein
MRINFASAQDARFWRAFERARDALREQPRTSRGPKAAAGL